MLERVLLVAAGLIVLVLAFFFLAAALVAGSVLAAVLLARMWWTHRKLRKAAERQFITTEYTVVERESPFRDRLTVDDAAHHGSDPGLHAHAGPAADRTAREAPSSGTSGLQAPDVHH
jgi:hypothetical protein